MLSAAQSLFHLSVDPCMIVAWSPKSWLVLLNRFQVNRRAPAAASQGLQILLLCCPCPDSCPGVDVRRLSKMISKMRGSIDRREDWVSELRDDGWVRLVKVASKDNLADILTKPMKGPEFTSLRGKTVNFQVLNILGGLMYLVDM